MELPARPRRAHGLLRVLCALLAVQLGAPAQEQHHLVEPMPKVIMRPPPWLTPYLIPQAIGNHESLPDLLKTVVREDNWVTGELAAC